MKKQPASPLHEYDTLIDLLQKRVLSRPGQTAFTFLPDGETEDSQLTYHELDQKARAIAALLQQHLGQPGERVLLLYPPGLEYITAFWGCLYAGMIAVPSYPPRLNRPDPRLQIIAQDAQARVALTTPQVLSSMEQRLANTPDLAAIHWLTSEDVDVQQSDRWQAPQVNRNTLAFLQYTSGSTAQPKGVMVSHGNLLQNLKQIHQFFGLTSQSRGVFWLPPYHDMGLIGGVLETLYTEGSSVIMPPTAFLQKPARWLQAISRYKATISGAPNFAYDFCVDKMTEEQKKDLDLSSWDLAFSGAEPIRKETIERFAATFEPYGFRRKALYACYGLAEATLIASGGKKGKSPTVNVFGGDELAQNQVVLAGPDEKNPRELVSCGKCAPDQELLIVDPQSLQACPPDGIGEIWLAGPSVAQGYWNRPEETAQTFQAHLADGGNGPFMRTGDLGFLHAGEVYITGRAKDLIIIRGRNHYPQDIELTVENSHPSLAPSSGAAFSVDVQDEERLVIVQEVDRHAKQEDAPTIIAAIRQAVAEQHELQVHAVVLIRVGSIPRTSSFKIQRRACRAQFLDGSLSVVGSDTLEIQPAHSDAAQSQQSQPNLIGKALAAIDDPAARKTLLTMYLQEQAARIMRVPAAQLDPEQSLSAFGLDSMMAIELKYAIETELQVTLPMEDFLQGGSMSELVERILESKPDISTSTVPLTPAPDEHPADMPLSHGQRSLWFLHQLAPDSAAYNIANAVTIRSALDVPALQRAFGALVRRHASLRTIFPLQEGGPVQHVLADLALPLRLEQVSEWSAARLQESLAQEAQRPFDLEQGPLLRASLLSRSAHEHIFQLVVHHIIADFWSLAVFADELGRLYAAELAGKPILLAPLPVQYTDYARWQADVLQGTEGARLLTYWKQKLAGELPALDLPIDHPRPPVQTYRGGSQSLRLDAELTQKLKDLGQQQGATLYMTLLAAFQVLLHRYTGQTDLLIGSPTAGRSRAELSHLVGYFINLVVLRSELLGNMSFAHFLEQVRQTVLDAFAHQDYPFGMLVEHLQPRRDPSRSPIFQVMFVLQKTPLLNQPQLASFALGEAGAQLDLHGLPLESMALEQLSAQFDLTLAAAETADGLGLSLQYNRDLFDENTARRMLEHLRILLQAIVAQPEQNIASLPLLLADERQMIAAWNERKSEYPERACVHELFEAQVERTPESVAVVFEQQGLTYGELNARANQLAHYLRTLGVAPGALVGLCVERSLDMLVGLLGILKAGGAYIPLDPMYPKDRLAYMLENSQAAVLLTQSHLSDQLPEVGQKICLDRDWPAIAAHPDTNPGGKLSNNLPAYVIYTSGSTGTPKGVQLRHRSVVNFLHSMRREPGLSDKDVLVSVTTLAFDIAALELFLPISVGARLVLASRAVTMDGALLSALLSSSGATCMQATPATWRLLLEAGWAGDRKLKILCGGEALPRDLADLLLERCAELWNMYGPTETTIWSATCRVESGQGLISIGHPIANTQLYILEPNGDLAPIGLPGELVIGGDGLAQGYFQRPDLTAEKFIPDPFAAPGVHEARLYRTGDLARFRTDENGGLFIEFLGRLDHQVKVRGFRIELAEIESLLNKHPGLKESVVVAQDWGASGGKRLVAYVIPSNGPAPAIAELRGFLKEKLPDYMLPSAFVTLEALPLTPNGKVNRKALPVPKDETAAEAEFVAPRGEMEQSIANIWKDVLQLEKVGMRDNFFDLGGHSLLMARVHRRLREELGRQISMVELFQYPTIDALVQYLSGGNGHKPAQPGGSRARFRRERMTQPEAGIAVIAMVGRFPGAGSVDEYWQNLSSGTESIRPFSDEELLAAGVDPALLADPNYVRAGAALDGVEDFDAAFFGYSPHEAEILDPQHRLFLECAWQALESAGYDSERYAGRIGVYASAGLNSYLINNLSSNRQFMQTADGYQTFIANDKDFVPTRVSYKLNLRGPSVNVQTACSSSLVAIHLAGQSLLAGECDMALAGGVSINVPHKAGYLYQERGIASPDGHCRAFDARAAGTVRGNGIGIVVLKRLSDAIADRDPICAVIRGSAINNDGSLKVGYTAPGIQGQAEAIAEALEISGVDPETIHYVETHGTGTEMGDPIEVTALAQAFGGLTDKKGFCAIGSVKTNIGHLDTAAGAAGFIKAVLALQHQAIPPSLNFEKPNPNIDFANSPFYVSTQLAEWKPNGAPLRAGVSSFGVGGTNAHVVLEAAPAPGPSGPGRAWQLLLLSAKTETALATATANLAAYLKDNPDQDLADIAYTLQVGRRTFNHRRILVCQDRAEALEALESLDPRKVLSAAQELKDSPVAFMFTGQGAQYVNMGAGLYETEPLFRQEIDRCAELLLPHLGLDLRRLLYPTPTDDVQQATQQLNQTQFTQPALFVIEYAMARLWMAWGLQPNAMIGHSIGEYVAACLAGVFSLEDALALVAARGRLMQSLPGGTMLAIPMSEKDVLPLLGDQLSLAAVNAKDLCVVSGPEAAVEELERRLSGKGLGVQRLHTSHAFHSAMVDPILDAFQQQVANVTRNAPRLPCISNVSGDWLTAEQAVDPAYWAQHLRRAVRFAQGVEKLFSDTAQVLLEVGPGRTLNTLATRHPARAETHVILSSLRHPQDQQSDSAFLLSTLGKLWLAGTPIDWAGFHVAGQRRRLPLPTYPFERQRFWVEADSSAAQTARLRDGTKKADMADWFYVPSWKRSALANNMTRLDENAPRWLLFADEYGLAVRLAAQLEKDGHEVTFVQAGDTFIKQSERTYTINPGHPADYEALFNDLHEQGKLPQAIVHAWNLTPDDRAGGALDTLDASLDRSFYSLLHMAQALGKRAIPEAIRVIALSNDLHEVTGEEHVVPEKATQLGPVQIISLEYPQLRCRSVDIGLFSPGKGIPQKLVETLGVEIRAAESEPIVAYRGPHRWVQTFEPVRLEEPKETTSRLRQEGVYLITGGLGGVGLTLARHLAQNVHARLILLGQSELPSKDEWNAWLAEHAEDDSNSRKIRQVQELEQLGGQVLVVRADVADPAQVRAAVARALEQFGVIHGVVHAAGVPGGGVIQLKTRSMAESVMAAKVRGTLALAEALQEQPLDFIVLCSSINAVVGRPGQVDYVAANAFLDAFGHAHPTLPVIDINWETWREVGMAAAAMQQWSARAGDGKTAQAIDHPLLVQRLPINEAADIYVSHLQVSKHWELNEHWVLNKPTLPGTAYLEMARAAFEAHTGQGVMEFRDVFFLKPLILEGDEQVEVRTLLKKQGNGFAFSVMSRTKLEADTWQEHAKGAVFPLEASQLVQQNLAEVEGRCSEREVADPLAQSHLGHFRLERGSLSAMGNIPVESILITDETDAQPRSMEFGPRWRTLQWVKLGAEEGLGFFELSKDFHADMGTYKLHPALLDFAASFLRLFKSEGSYLPLSYKRLKLSGPLPARFYSHARFVGEHAAGSATLRFDLSLLDEHGTEWVRVEEFSVVKIGDAAKLGAAGRGTSPDEFFDAQRAQREQALRASGLSKDLANGLLPGEGAQVFDRILSSGLSRVVVSTRDLQARIEHSRAQSDSLASGTGEQGAARPRHPRPQLMTAYAVPRNQAEQKLAEIWQEVLGIDQVGVHDNFFELGGDSLLITRIHAKFVESFERDISVANLMQYPTIADLAQQLAQHDRKTEEPSFEAVRERSSKQKEAMQLRKQKMLKQRQR